MLLAAQSQNNNTGEIIGDIFSGLGGLATTITGDVTKGEKAQKADSL